MNQLLLVAQERGIHLDLDQPIPDRYLKEPSRLGKLEALRDSLKILVDSNGRLHPHWGITEKGFMVCHSPNILTLPFEWVESGVLDVGVGSLEVVLAAKSLGEFALADEILIDPDQSFSRVLASIPEFQNLSRTNIKKAMYQVILGLKTVTGSEEDLARTQILSLFPKLGSGPEFGGRPTPRSLVTDFVLCIAQEAEDTEGCRVVGFFHDTPLIECDRTDSEVVAARLKGLSIDLLRSWSGADPLQRLQMVT